MDSFRFFEFLKCNLKIQILSGAVEMIVYSYNILIKKMNSNTFSKSIALLISAGTGALIYFILIYLLKIDEVDWMINAVKDKLNKITNKAQV